MQVDHKALGAQMRRNRERAKVSLREMAGYLGFSAAFVSDMERGRRNWSDTTIKHYSRRIERKP